MLDIPVFPQEIFDHIIELWKDDRSVLLATSLVCRNWVHVSRRHLFKSITIRPSTLNAFRTLCDKNALARPTFLHHVRNLVFELSGRQDNYFITPKPSLYVDKDLISWFPQLDSVKTISIWSIEWESKEMLHGFSLLFPNVTSLTLRANAFNNHTHGLILICSFPKLKKIHWFKGVAYTFEDEPLPALPSLPITRILPSRLSTVSFDMDSFSRDTLIRSIPLGAIRLENFRVYISSAESMACLYNLVLFMQRHCLDVSSLTIKFHEAKFMAQDEWTNTESFQIVFEMFTDLFPEFRSLSHLTIQLTSDWKDFMLCPWVYQALESLRPELMIESLILGLPVPTDENGDPGFNIDSVRKKVYVNSCVDREAIIRILRERQFRALKKFCFVFN